MFNHQQGFAVIADADEQLAERHFFRRVHPGGGFIQRQQQRIRCQRAGDFKPTLMAIGQVAGAIVGELRNAGIVQPVPGQLAGLLLFFASAFMAAQRGPQAVTGAHVAAHHHVFQHRHLVEEAHVLEGAGNPGGGHFLYLLREVGLIGNRKLAAVRRIKPGDQVKAGGFSRAVGADQPVDLASVHGNRNVIHGSQPAEAF